MQITEEFFNCAKATLTECDDDQAFRH